MRLLRDVIADTEAMQRLHEVERMVARDIVSDARHLRCAGCTRLAEALIAKARSR